MTLEHDKVYSPTDVQELLKIDSSTLKKCAILLGRLQQTGDSFFVAFDFGPQTFRWDYEKEQPAALTRIAVQRMLQKEAK